MREQNPVPSTSDVQSSACCDTVLLSACCGEDAKPACCGPKRAPVVCGCGDQPASDARALANRVGCGSVTSVVRVLPWIPCATQPPVLQEAPQRSSSVRLAALANAQSTIARDWGCLDGESSRRMLALIDRLLTSANRKPN